MLSVHDLRVSYGAVEAISGVSLEVPDGAVTAVLGANGAGKTTLLRTITGLVRPRSGRVAYDGVELTSLRAEEIVRRGVAHVPEGRGVIQDLTVDENLRLGALWRSDRDDRKKALEEVYELFPPLDTRRRQSAYTLSGGERQMLAIGRALMARPKLLLLDEPSLGLAPLITAQIMALLRQLSSESGLTVLLVEQNARSALSIADQGIVLALGKVVVTAEASRLAEDEDLRHHYLGF
ncbi:MAG TPA: ABC transporter ATP-binding protein [Acidimicrobiales bacterium]|nr:ABC transporter ATP-binding protein [Acidimicrobiales bacterium]